MTVLADAISTLRRTQPIRLVGTVAEVRGLTLLVADLPLPVGAMVEVETAGQTRRGEVVGFDDEQTIVMLMSGAGGLRRGDRVFGQQFTAEAPVGNAMLGRVVNALGRPIDGRGRIPDRTDRPVMPEPTSAMDRVPIDKPLSTGIRALDAMLSVGRGQRLGIFAGPGVGKSTLLGQIARNTDADVSVIALVGERGREVQDFLHQSLGTEGLQRSVVVVSTGDEPALMRVRAAFYALTVAEHFRDQGRNVMLFMDSVTRFCQAQRQIGLAIGEPPAAKGYPPSVFAMLPSLFERAGRLSNGSITAFYAILVEGDDMTEPIADAARGTLDGHVTLSRELAAQAHWPAIDALESVSRLANDVADKTQQNARNEVLRLLSEYRKVEDLVNIGAYAHGSNPRADLAIDMKEQIDMLLRQRVDERSDFNTARKQLLALAQAIAQKSQQQTRSRNTGQ